MLSFLRRNSSYEDLAFRYDALIARRRYKKAWHLCQEYSLSRNLDDFSFTFSVEGAKVGLLAAKAAEKAGAPKRAYIESSISVLIIKNELQYPTTHKSDLDKKNLVGFLIDLKNIRGISLGKLNEKAKKEAEQEIDQIRALFERLGKENMRLSMLVEQKIGLNFLEKWLLRRRMKAMHKYRNLER